MAKGQYVNISKLGKSVTELEESAEEHIFMKDKSTIAFRYISEGKEAGFNLELTFDEGGDDEFLFWNAR